MTISSETDTHYLKQYENMAFGQRLAYLIEARGISKAWIAERLGISKQALNYLLKHSIKPKFVNEFAELLGVQPQWIVEGIGTSLGKEKNNVKVSTIPLITNAILLGQTSKLEEKKDLLDFSHLDSETIIAYKLEDESNFPPFIEGSILIFDLEKKVSHKDYVLLKIQKEIFVRQYLIDGKDICFKASNALHKTFINPQVSILGVLVEARYQPN